MSDEIVYEDATSLARQVRSRARSSAEIVSAYYDRIEAVDPIVNAIPTRLERDEALRLAAQADAAVAEGANTGPLHGLPIAIKDAQPTAGMRTTMGSPLLEHWAALAGALLAGVVLGGALAVVTMTRLLGGGGSGGGSGGGGGGGLIGGLLRRPRVEELGGWMPTTVSVTLQEDMKLS